MNQHQRNIDAIALFISAIDPSHHSSKAQIETAQDRLNLWITRQCFNQRDLNGLTQISGTNHYWELSRYLYALYRKVRFLHPEMFGSYEFERTMQSMLESDEEESISILSLNELLENVESYKVSINPCWNSHLNGYEKGYLRVELDQCNGLIKKLEDFIVRLS